MKNKIILLVILFALFISGRSYARGFLWMVDRWERKTNGLSWKFSPRVKDSHGNKYYTLFIKGKLCSQYILYDKDGYKIEMTDTMNGHDFPKDIAYATVQVTCVTEKQPRLTSNQAIEIAVKHWEADDKSLAHESEREAEYRKEAKYASENDVWTVSFDDNSNTLGGRFFIFVNDATGEVVWCERRNG